jgi:hypothetical protein
MKDLTFKGTVSQDFWHQIFLGIIFPQAPENNIRVIGVPIHLAEPMYEKNLKISLIAMCLERESDMRFSSSGFIHE